VAREALISAVKVRILKPLDRPWDEIGARLRDLSWIGHRVLNGTMTRLALAAELPDRIPDDWCSKKNDRSEKRPGGKPSAYQMAARAIERANKDRVQARACVWCNGSGVEPASTPVNKRGQAIKRTKAQDKRSPSPGGVCSRCDGAKEYRVGEPVEVPSAIQAGWQRMADRRHAADRMDVLKGAKSLASYKAPAPIAITSSGEAFAVRCEERVCACVWCKGSGNEPTEVPLDAQGKPIAPTSAQTRKSRRPGETCSRCEGAKEARHTSYLLDIPLYPGGASGRVTFVVKPDGKGAYSHLRKMVEPGGKLGDLKLISQNKKWIAVISYSWERDKPVPRSGTDAVIGCAADGSPELRMGERRPKRLFEGASIKRQRRIFTERRKSRSKHQRDIGAGARGHGRKRVLRHYRAVDDSEREWVRSICQQIAAKAVREADRRGARWVRIDDAFTALPQATLRQHVSHALNKAGFAEPTELAAGSNPGGERGSP